MASGSLAVWPQGQAAKAKNPAKTDANIFIIFCKFEVGASWINRNNSYFVQPPLSTIPAALLKLFRAYVPDKHLGGLKITARLLLEKARDKADAVWNEKGDTDEKTSS